MTAIATIHRLHAPFALARARRNRDRLRADAERS